MTLRTDVATTASVFGPMSGTFGDVVNELRFRAN